MFLLQPNVGYRRNMTKTVPQILRRLNNKKCRKFSIFSLAILV
jgi:hypothetical protein